MEGLEGAIRRRRIDAGALTRMHELMAHPNFSLSNPNRVRSLIGAFAYNLKFFHAVDGSGYRLVADVVKALDGKNPQVAARLLTAFGDHRRYDAPRRAQSQAVLDDVAACASSSDVADIARRLLAVPPAKS
ncbi:MAG: aminopeptidase N C-terminal domain-containing protein [Pseudomonadota bacterium]